MKSEISIVPITLVETGIQSCTLVEERSSYDCQYPPDHNPVHSIGNPLRTEGIKLECMEFHARNGLRSESNVLKSWHEDGSCLRAGTCTTQ